MRYTYGMVAPALAKTASWASTLQSGKLDAKKITTESANLRSRSLASMANYTPVPEAPQLASQAQNASLNEDLLGEQSTELGGENPVANNVNSMDESQYQQMLFAQNMFQARQQEAQVQQEAQIQEEAESQQNNAITNVTQTVKEAVSSARTTFIQGLWRGGSITTTAELEGATLWTVTGLGSLVDAVSTVRTVIPFSEDSAIGKYGPPAFSFTNILSLTQFLKAGLVFLLISVIAILVLAIFIVILVVISTFMQPIQAISSLFSL